LIFVAALLRTEPQRPTKLAHRGALVARDWRIRAHFFHHLSTFARKFEMHTRTTSLSIWPLVSQFIANGHSGDYSNSTPSAARYAIPQAK